MLLNRLPRELRDMIYDYYTTEDGGYHFWPESGKLRTSSGDKIELSLMYSCKATAAEMRDMPFRNNVIHFKTSPADNRSSPHVRDFSALLEDLYSAKWNTLCRAKPFITDAIARRVVALFPQSAAFIEQFSTKKVRVLRDCRLRKWGMWGLAPSFHRDAIAVLLCMVAQNPAFVKLVSQDLTANRHGLAENTIVQRMYSLHPKPWWLPSRDDVAAMERKMPRGWVPMPREPVRDSTRYYISAASQALGFLSQLPSHIRTGVRHLELHELNASIAYPECHVRGLIPYSIENPNLKIFRRVDLWKTVLASQQLPRHEYQRYSSGFIRSSLANLEGKDVSMTVAPWFQEASALETAGMPPNVFTLTFEGKADFMQPIFDILTEDASWQDALQQWTRRDVVSPFVREQAGTIGEGYKRCDCYFFDEFPDLMKNVIMGAGSVEFKNCYAQAWNVEQIIVRNSNCQGVWEWWMQWQGLRRFQVIVPPLPCTWDTILKEHVCEEDMTMEA